MKTIKNSPKLVAGIAGAVIIAAALTVFTTVRSWGNESQPNNPASRSRPNLLANQTPVRTLLALTPDQIEKFHAVERKYLHDLNALLDGRLTRRERRARRDQITLKINDGVKEFLSDEQYAKLIQIEREEGSFRKKT